MYATTVRINRTLQNQLLRDNMHMTCAAVSQNCYKRTPQIKYWHCCLPRSLVKDKLLIQDVRPRKVRIQTLVTHVMLSEALHGQPILRSCSPGPGTYWGVYGSLKVSLFGDFSCVSIVPKLYLFTGGNRANVSNMLKTTFHFPWFYLKVFLPVVKPRVDHTILKKKWPALSYASTTVQHCCTSGL